MRHRLPAWGRDYSPRGARSDSWWLSDPNGRNGQERSGMKRIILAMAITGCVAACQKLEQAPAAAADAGYQKVLIERLLDAKPGDVIQIPAGRFAFDRSLSLRVDGVTIRGAGQDKT